jgi:hypothetical protein
MAMDFSLVARGSGSSQATASSDAAAYRIIDNQAAWEAFWSARPDPVPQDSIDFSRDIVLCVFRGQKPTGGYGISVTSIQRRGDNITVSLEMSDPAPGSMLTQALTNPFAVYRVAVPEGTDLRSEEASIRFVRATPQDADAAPAPVSLQRLP